MERETESQRGASVAYLDGSPLTSIYRGSNVDDERNVIMSIIFCQSHGAVWASLNDFNDGRAFCSVRM